MMLCQNRRTQTFVFIAVLVSLLLLITIGGLCVPETAYAPDYELKKAAPSLAHLFGTDYLGRDMFFRTLKGLAGSVFIGLLAAFVSGLLALFLGIMASSFGGITDKIISWLTDLFLSIPHIVLLILISFMMDRGMKGVIIGISLTHWPSLTRVIRSEALSIRETQYVKAALKLGKSKWYTAYAHIIPHIIPQFITGLILLFPHAVLHEAGITFLGFGLSIDTPAIGNILSESLKYMASGMWWLIVFPGAALVLLVLLFHQLGNLVTLLLNPKHTQE